MKILCTFPGKIGDILWSLPTARMISRHFGQPVDFATTLQYGSEGLLRLIREQEYIATAYILPGWVVEDKECMQPREPETSGYDRVFHLGYRGWPDEELAAYTYKGTREYAELNELPVDLDMSPWISLPGAPATNLPCVFVGWNQEWIELKMGLLYALTRSVPKPMYYLCHAEGMRHQEFPMYGIFREEGDMYAAAGLMAECDFYFGDLSSQWVLANAMGKPCVVMEPSEARWNPIFWWDGDGRNRMVRGGDGKPTFDARHVRDAILQQLKEIK